jgi:hypothetical protein
MGSLPSKGNIIYNVFQNNRFFFLSKLRVDIIEHHIRYHFFPLGSFRHVKEASTFHLCPSGVDDFITVLGEFK